MKFIHYLLTNIALFSINAYCLEAPFDALENFQINNDKMISAGLPTKQHFEKLKEIGVTHVIDLIPGDRSEEAKLMIELDLDYYNIPVEWSNPTIDNFNEYALLMEKFSTTSGKTLTHCRLNWRGAVFTYLYRIKYLNESENIAKSDLLNIWQPDDVWQEFINKVKALPQSNP